MYEGLVRRSSASLAFGVALLLGAGCSSEVDSSGKPGAGPATPGPMPTATAAPTGTGTSGGPGPAPTAAPTTPGSPGPAPTGMQPTPATACTGTPQVAPAPMRRLTRFEYANSVKTLLNVDADVSSLPVDEIANGFNNNSAVLTVSPLHAEKYVMISETVAKAAVANLATLTGCDAAAKGEDACAAEYAKRLGRKAFRRALSAEEEAGLTAAYTAGKTGGSYAEGIEVMVRAVLQSPSFIFRLELTAPPSATDTIVKVSPHELATRLSYLLWASGPDDALLDAAEKGELASKEQVAAKARTMLQDPRAKAALTEFYSQWVGTSRLDVTSKNTTLFPLFSDAVRAEMEQEMPAFLDYVLFQGDHKLSTLLTSPVGFVGPALAPIYGVTAAGPGLQMVTLPDAQKRAGILTQAGFLAVQAHPDQTSPVLRGKFIRTRLLCQPPPPPPDDANVNPPEVMAGATARERFSAHFNSGAGCASCHQLMDPIGFAFENYDSIGQFRTQENGRDIDVSGEVMLTNDPALQGKFVGVRELSDKLAASEQVRDCLATQWFRYAAGRAETDADMCSMATLQESFGTSGGDLVELAVGITQTDAFWNRGVAQ